MQNDDERFVCPITRDYFCDPVRAEDGFLYERAAFVKWINKDGTSPLTRGKFSMSTIWYRDKKAEQQ